jgi:hypothetical protein
MDFILIKMTSPKWDEMWDWVASHPINQGLEEPSVALNEGYSWEYMGTYLQGNKAVSEFLHRQHPNTSTLHKLSYGHEIGPDDIEKKYRI